ncbi:type II toxin-antitoxin system RelE/ParE family toxin [Streptomyces polyrhachis]|uniref:Type II toxin-antitoxin system RelE/ParE family toxin n=1 Tax=Streptomyces polyrhachis TaxID=1282885 RepID=A0ABW2GFZ5_9ACTN
MKYTFDFRPGAQKDLRSIPRPEALRLLQALATLGDDPYAPNPAAKPLNGHPGLYRIRSGDYRAVYRVIDDRLVIYVIHVGDRRDIYRDL